MKLTKLLSLVIITVMVGFPQSSFAHWSNEYTKKMVSMGYMNGYGDNDFKEDNYITRAEFAAVLNRVTCCVSFSDTDIIDVKDSDWYKRDVDIAVTNGFFKGYPDKSFKPNNNITRQEAAVCLYKIFGTRSIKDIDFRDEENISSWAKEAVSDLSESKIINGYSDNSFKPDDFITRGETAAIFSRLISMTLKNENEITDKIIDGNLIIASAVETSLKNVTVNGNIYISPSLKNSKLKLEGCSVSGTVVIGSNNGNILFENTKCNRIIAPCNTVLKNTIVLTGNTLINEGLCEGCEIKKINLVGKGILSGNNIVDYEENKSVSMPSSYSGSNGSSGGGGGGNSSGNIYEAVDYSVKSLMISDECMISPSFNKNVLDYVITIPYTYEDINLTPSFDNSVDVRIKGTDIKNSEAYNAKNLIYGSNMLFIDVYDGLEKVKTYKLNIVRTNEATAEKIKEINDKIGNLTIEDLKSCNINYCIDACIINYNEKLLNEKIEVKRELTQLEIQDVINNVNESVSFLKAISIKTMSDSELVDFRADITSYKIYVDCNTNSADLNLEKISEKNKVTVNNTAFDCREVYQINNLAYGDNICKVEVISADETRKTLYTVDIIRDSDENNRCENAFFNNSCDGFEVKNGEMVYNKGKAVLSGMNSEFSSSQKFSVLKGTNITVSFKVDSQAANIACFVKKSDNSVVWLDSYNEVSDSICTASYIAEKSEEMQFGFMYDSCLSLSYFKVSYESENNRVLNFSLDSDYEMISNIENEDSESCVLKLNNPVSEVILKIQPEDDSADVSINDEPVCERKIFLEYKSTQAKARITARSGAVRYIDILIIRPEIPELDLPDAQALERINQNPFETTKEDLQLCKIVSIYSELIPDYQIKLSSFREQGELTQEIIQDIILKVNKIMFTIYEAEEATLGASQCIVSPNDDEYISGCSGKHSGMISNDETSSIDFGEIYVPYTKVYTVKLRYHASDIKDGKLRLVVNGSNYDTDTFTLNSENGWCFASFNILINEGYNSISVPSVDNSDINFGIYVDYISVEKYKMNLPLKLEGEKDALIEPVPSWWIKSNGTIIAYRGAHTFKITAEAGTYIMSVRWVNASWDSSHYAVVNVNGKTVIKTTSVNKGSAEESKLTVSNAEIELKDGENVISVTNDSNPLELYTDYIIINKK